MLYKSRTTNPRQRDTLARTTEATVQQIIKQCSSERGGTSFNPYMLFAVIIFII